jgi:16S rRNA (cytidine1402-2'-O)-methyltransferase
LGILYVVSTPIGNLEDMSARGLRILAEVELIAAEDTRTARRLLTHFGIHGRLVSYNEHNRRARIPELLRHLATASLALISEAGTPVISDPGQALVAAAIDAGFEVRAIPGASAVLTALCCAGLPARQFVFLGFLPRQGGDRRAQLRMVADYPQTLVCFEAPTRLRATLADLLACLGDRRLAICRELTKLHEEVLRLRLSEAVSLPQEPRGEYTLVVEGAGEAQPPAIDEQILQELAALQTAGRSARGAIATMALRHHLPRRSLYDAWLALQRESGNPAHSC